MVPIAPVIILLVRLISHGLAQGGHGGNNAVPPRFTMAARTFVWVLVFLAWVAVCVFAFGTAITFISVGHVFTRADLEIFPMLGGVAIGVCYLFLAWRILRHFARRGHPKLVYYLAHLAFIFPTTGETYAGASLLAALALAHRGDATQKEREWIQKRLAKESRHLGTYATACALHQMLVARAARDEGRLRDAEELSQRARTILGTITYLSDRGIPHGVRKVAYELLALDDARRGHWRSLEMVPLKDLTPIAGVLRGWGELWFGGGDGGDVDLDDEKEDGDADSVVARSVNRKKAKRLRRQVERLRRKVASPIIDRLFIRPRGVTLPTSAHAAWSRSRRDFVALLRAQPLGPRALMNMLVGFDILFHPESPDTILPEAIRTDEALVAQIHDEVAAAIADPFARAGAPIHALNVFGDISARVHQQVETSLFNEMDRALADLDARLDIGDRLDPFGEWCQVSYLRSIYRRLEMHLGIDAVGRVWPRFVYRYCKLGVDLSEMYPRMRPLAHAVFRCLSGEAARFNDVENVKQQKHNMSVTEGVS